MALLQDADPSRRLVDRTIRDTVLGECSTEQELAKRREEKSVQGAALVLPFRNCVLSSKR